MGLSVPEVRTGSRSIGPMSVHPSVTTGTTHQLFGVDVEGTRNSYRRPPAVDLNLTYLDQVLVHA